MLIVLLVVSYGNSFSAFWHLDDFPNIIFNARLHLKSLDPSSIYQTFFAYPMEPGRIYRPVACLSFALNWFFDQSNVTGYHIVNLLIHCSTALLLLRCILLLFKTPRIRGQYNGNELFISVLATAFWALNPIQTQAVTYIVQRMAQMAAFFSLLGIYFFLKGRLIEETHYKKAIFFFACFVSFLLALGSKENSILFPINLFLIEFIFFRTGSLFRKRDLIFGACIFLSLLAAFFWLSGGNPNQFLSGYKERSFTLWQRLLTEPRVLVFYLSQLFYPVPTRLSVEHHFQASQSLFTPGTTIAAILFLTFLTAFALIIHKRQPAIAFAILFFLINHLIESTVLPLELIFEHRNYLPSLFLFFPVAVAAQRLLNYYQKRNHVMREVLCGFFICLIIGFGMGTYIRNQAWATEKSLWEDAFHKAPQNSRPYINLSHAIRSEGDFESAIRLNQQALLAYSPTPWKTVMRANNNIGMIMMEMGKIKESIVYFDRSLGVSPDNAEILLSKLRAQIAAGLKNEALTTLDRLNNIQLKQNDYLIGKAGALLHFGRYQEAIELLRRAAFSSDYNSKERKKALFMIGMALCKQQCYAKAAWFLEYAQTLESQNLIIGLGIVENRIREGDKKNASLHLQNLLMSYTLPQTAEILNRACLHDIEIPLDGHLLMDFMTNHLQQKSNIPSDDKR
ncbi:MAG: hypothetical protein V1714_04480 [Pseudomonadota bacterium]